MIINEAYLQWQCNFYVLLVSNLFRHMIVWTCTEEISSISQFIILIITLKHHTDIHCVFLKIFSDVFREIFLGIFVLPSKFLDMISIPLFSAHSPLKYKTFFHFMFDSHYLNQFFPGSIRVKNICSTCKNTQNICFYPSAIVVN